MYFLIESIIPEITNNIKENLTNKKIENFSIINENFFHKENNKNNEFFLLQTLLAKKQFEFDTNFINNNIVSFSNFFLTLSKNFSFLNQKKNFSFLLEVIDYLKIKKPDLIILLTANKYTLNRLYKNKYNEKDIDNLLELQNNTINLIEKMNLKYELINIDLSEKKINNKILNILRKKTKKGN